MPPYNPPISHYCHIVGFKEKDDMFKFMGPNGHNFKRLTTKLRLDYLWWNMETNLIEVWGKYDTVNKAQKYITKYMKRFYEKHLDPYRDMPELME